MANPTFEQATTEGKPSGFELAAGAKWRRSIGDPGQEMTGGGVLLPATGGSVSQTVPIDVRQGRAFSFRFRGLPLEDFKPTALSMKVEFFGNGGKTSYDSKRKEIYPLVEKQRRDLAVNGNGKTGGAATWHDYLLTFYVPFTQVDRVKLTVDCAGGGKVVASKPAESRRGMKRVDISGSDFLMTDFRLTRLPEPTAPAAGTAGVANPAAPKAEEKRIPLGGRWFYAAKPDEVKPPELFNYTNADRLLYQDGPNGQCQAPFAGNMSAILRAGNLDVKGEAVAADRPLADNVTVRFDGTSMIVHTRGIPNHPTGRFPEEGRGNPNSIQEQDKTFYIPLVPKENPKHFALPADGQNNNALNMGSIGVAANGVVFFNPFDAGDMDASSIMDRCCGHPNQEGEYHYHKYPICLNSPWSDEGNAHSPLLGWAFDGFPIYGPYESKDKMAKDVTGTTALNAFNMHYDEQRGWHYHVTPGKFPYMIGGYWGTADSRNVRRMGPPGGRRGPGPGGPPPRD